MFVIFFISALAETNRPPFDLPEAEAELVAGYQTEYSGMMYAMFWLGEYANILLMCAMGSVLFLGGWLPPIDIFPFNAIIEIVNPPVRSGGVRSLLKILDRLSPATSAANKSEILDQIDILYPRTTSWSVKGYNFLFQYYKSLTSDDLRCNF